MGIIIQRGSEPEDFQQDYCTVSFLSLLFDWYKKERLLYPCLIVHSGPSPAFLGGRLCSPDALLTAKGSSDKWFWLDCPIIKTVLMEINGPATEKRNEISPLKSESMTIGNRDNDMKGLLWTPNEGRSMMGWCWKIKKPPRTMIGTAACAGFYHCCFSVVSHTASPLMQVLFTASRGTNSQMWRHPRLIASLSPLDTLGWFRHRAKHEAVYRAVKVHE